MPKKKFMKKSLTKKVNFLLKQNKQNRPELLFVDTVGNDVDISSTPSIVKIVAATENNGKRGTIKSIQLKGLLELKTAQTANVHFRIIIFTDKANEGGAVPAWGDIYKGAVGTDAIISLRAIADETNEGTRFKILYDRRMKLINDTTSGVVNDSMVFDMFKKLNIRSIDSTESTWWESGGLYMAFLSTVSGGNADYTYQIRTRFVQQSD